MATVGQRIVFPNRGEVAIEPFELPEPGPHQVLVRTVRTAISAGTELTRLLGANPRDASQAFPASPGYSNVGVITAAGKRVEGFRVDDLVLSMKLCSHRTEPAAN
jgi:NADPH:quinone reductase-like Zn-dependent oxidoreductase